MTVHDVVARRRAERRALLSTARRFVDELATDHRLQAAVVYGSVARGDFNAGSDIDLLVITDDLADEPLSRVWLRDRLQVIGWTRADWRARRGRDPIAVEATEAGVWLLGSPEDLLDDADRQPFPDEG